MTDNQREQIKALRIDGYGYTKIAQTLEMSVNTVKSYCKRNNVSIKTTEPETPKDVCKNCGEKINQIDGKKKRKFCSVKCCTEWWNSHSEMVNKKATYSLICKHCGVEFKSYGNKNRLYCCHACYISDRFGKVVKQR